MKTNILIAHIKERLLAGQRITPRLLGDMVEKLAKEANLSLTAEEKDVIIFSCKKEPVKRFKTKKAAIDRKQNLNENLNDLKGV